MSAMSCKCNHELASEHKTSTHVFFSQHLGCTGDLILWRCKLARVSTTFAGGASRRLESQHIRMMREIMDVPLPLAASRRLISFLIFQISICGRASSASKARLTEVHRSRRADSPPSMIGVSGARRKKRFAKAISPTCHSRQRPPAPLVAGKQQLMHRARPALEGQLEGLLKGVAQERGLGSRAQFFLVGCVVRELSTYVSLGLVRLRFRHGGGLGLIERRANYRIGPAAHERSSLSCQEAEAR